MVWSPENEDELRAALDAGNLREHRGLDFKRQIGNGDGARRNTAIDLASFALHGGQLVIGVAEDKDAGTFSLAPQPLAGEAERLEDIARHRIDPPLLIRVRDIPTTTDPTLGYLFVEVPPSPSAPHMVDGRYYARGDRTNRTLTDADVVQLHAGRERREDEVRRILDEWTARPVVDSGTRRSGHLHLVAEPLIPSNPRAFQHVARSQDPAAARALATAAGNGIRADLRAFEPKLSSGSRWHRRADGGALTDLEPGLPGLKDNGWEDGLVDLELHDNGGIRILLGRHTAMLQTRGRDVKVVFDMASLGYAWSLVLLARGVAESSGYRGPWGFGVSADRLAGKHSFAVLEDQTSIASFVEPYAGREYSEVTTAHLEEIEDAPAAVAERLVGRLLHGLGSHQLLIR